MTLNQRISAFVQLGELFTALSVSSDHRIDQPAHLTAKLPELDAVIQREYTFNGWFTETNVRQALGALGSELNRENLEPWVGRYQLPDRQDAQRRVGLILAGNIPMVGFHDVLCTVLSGHHALVKLSRDDNRLLPMFLGVLLETHPELKEFISFTPGQLPKPDALIATGSNNTARHFEYYFKSVPRIIRKNRTSVAVLDGTESTEELEALGHDVFDYFGLGCRNVTKVLLPTDFDLDRLFGAFFKFKEIGNHNKYANNYDYHKALWLLNRESLLENGFLIVKEDPALVSPVGSLFIERYSDASHPKNYIENHRDEIQCVVGHGFTPFGNAQCPKLNDYADGVDTLAFLSSLK